MHSQKGIAVRQFEKFFFDLSSPRRTRDCKKREVFVFLCDMGLHLSEMNPKVAEICDTQGLTICRRRHRTTDAVRRTARSPE